MIEYIGRRTPNLCDCLCGLNNIGCFIGYREKQVFKTEK